MSERALVVTQIWEYAWTEEIGAPPAVHCEAAGFLERLLADPGTGLYLSAYQVAEVMDVLRKAGLSRHARDEVCDLLQLWCQCVDLSVDDVFECVALSLASGIHVYDYLVAVPLRGLVDVIYTADSHFLEDPTFGAIAPVVNPMTWEMHEGHSPRPRTG